MAKKTATKSRSPKELEYAWQKNVGRGLEAATVAATVQEIEERDGVCKPQALVEEARPASSPLHPLFDWNDGEAAEQWRTHQARNVINNIRFVIRTSNKDRPQKVVTFVSVQSGEERGYMNTLRVVSDETLNQRMLDDALTQLEAWQNRWGHLSSMQPVVDAINQALKKKP